MTAKRRLDLSLSLFAAGLLVSLAVFLNGTQTVLAQDVTLTQNGIGQATDDGQGNFPPLDITFPQQFGGTPTVTATYPVAAHYGGRFHVSIVPATPVNVTSTGFRVVLPKSGNGSGEHLTAKVTWAATGPALQRGTVIPKYMVLTVVYAPPGTGGGHSTSSVSYQAGSTAGTLTSSSQTFKEGISASVEASGGILGNGGSLGVAFTGSQSTTDSQSVEIKKSTTTTISQAGPSQDGINHDEDEIWLLLKPTVNMAVSSSTTEWSLAATNAPVQYVHVGWLNGHETMPPGVVAALQDAGITPHEYPKILARDPLAADESALNSVRFASINTTFPYEPPYSLNDSVPTFTYNISNSTVTTTGTAAEDSFGVELSVSGSASFTGLFDVKVKDTSTWEWTNKFSTSASAGSSQSAQLTIGGPAYGYAGASVIRVYYDTIYRTFAFALVSPAAPEVALKGTLLTPTGKPAANKRVTLIGSGQKHLTYTNAKGEFTFIGHMSGKVTVQAPGVTQQIPQVQSTRQIVLHP